MTTTTVDLTTLENLIRRVVREELARSATPSAEEAMDWDTLARLFDNCAVDTGIDDLAHQHDHYLYGTPKRED